MVTILILSVNSRSGQICTCIKLWLLGYYYGLILLRLVPLCRIHTGMFSPLEDELVNDSLLFSLHNLNCHVFSMSLSGTSDAYTYM